jgi:hypothetical protein
LYTYIYPYVYLFTQGGRGRVEPERREMGNRKEYRTQSWFENTNMTMCVELGKMPLITSGSKCLGDDDEWIGLLLSL